MSDDDKNQPEIEAPFMDSQIAKELVKLSPFDNPTAWRRSFTALAAEQAPLALASVIELLHSRDPMARVMAARMILEYGMGRPVDAAKHDAVNHKVLEGRGNTVRWSTPDEATDAALSRAADDAPVTLKPLLPPAAPVMAPDAQPIQADVDDVPQDDGVEAANEQPGMMAPLPIVDMAKMFGEERGITTDDDGLKTSRDP